MQIGSLPRMSTQILSFGKPSTCKNNVGAETMQTGSVSRISTQMLSLGKPNTSENNVGGRDNANRQSAKDEDTNTQLWRPALLKTMLWANKTQIGSLPRTRTLILSFGKPST